MSINSDIRITVSSDAAISDDRRLTWSKPANEEASAQRGSETGFARCAKESRANRQGVYRKHCDERRHNRRRGARCETVARDSQTSKNRFLPIVPRFRRWLDRFSGVPRNRSNLPCTGLVAPRVAGSPEALRCPGMPLRTNRFRE
jgi:hypothetical protein